MPNSTGAAVASDPVELIATAAFGLEAVVGREVTALGYQATTLQPGRLLVPGDRLAICRLNLHLRAAERVLIRVGTFPAEDFGQLFDGTSGLPWERWIPRDGVFPVSGRSIQSQLSSVPACQRIVKKAIVERLRKAHGVEDLPETSGSYAVEVALLADQVTLSIDTTGIGLHKRGYRPISGLAPLRETLAAALVMLSFWKDGRPLIDPFCGTGTILIEAAGIGRRMAPGAGRQFASEAWPELPSPLWRQARDEAQDTVLAKLSTRVLGLDIHDGALGLARQNAQAAGVAEDIHFQNRPFAELSSKQEYGCIITNPPYGHRMRDDPQLDALYRSIPTVLRRLPTWSHYILTAYPDLERRIGQQADRRRKLYNGRIECQYFQFHGPRPPRKSASPALPRPAAELEPAAQPSAGETATDVSPAPTPTPAFGGLDPQAERQAQEFHNRLTRRARHLRRWPARGVCCYRLYERDIPDVPLVVDRYEDRLHMAEFARPHSRTPAEHADWLDLMMRTAADVMGVHPSQVFMKFRDRQRGTSQYERRGSAGSTLVVREGGLRFKVNLSDYVDTGLFLDHRITRQMVREMANGLRVLNLFAYTGAFTVYAAAGGARQTTSVDLSRTYLDWAEENLELNGLAGPQHRRIQSDAAQFVRDLHPDVQFDLAVVDPPTFSNRKGTVSDWETQRDHVEFLLRLVPHIASEGTIFFSTNFRRFKLQTERLLAETDRPVAIREISHQTVPPDFRNRRIHRCWRMTVGR